MMLNQKGLGLIQVMAAIAAVGGFTYAIIQNSSISGKQQVKATFDFQYEAQVQEIQTHLADLKNCTATLQGKTFTSTPTSLTGISTGNMTSSDPLVITNAGTAFSIRKPNSLGVYIESVTFMTKNEVDPADPSQTITNDVVRVEINHANIGADGVIKNKAKGLGVTSRSHEFIIQSGKDASGKVTYCFSDSINVVKNACESMLEAVWNPQTKKCEFPNAVLMSDLINVYTKSNPTTPVGRLVKP